MSKSNTKTAPKGLKLSTVLFCMGAMLAGAVTATAMSGGASAQSGAQEVESTSMAASGSDACPRLIRDHACRIDAAIEAATR